MYRIAVLAGDGIGPEIISQARRVILAVAQLHQFEVTLQDGLIGGAAYDATGHPLPPDTLTLCKSSHAVMLGAVGGPQYDSLPTHLRPEVGALLPLRKELGLFANLRPARLFPSLAAISALRPDLVKDGLDILVVRELTGGIYFGKPSGRSEDGSVATDTCTYSRHEIERILHVGFNAAQKRNKKVCSVDKANVLETSRFWREICLDVAMNYPDVELSHMLVDNCAMQLVRDPSQFDVIVTENLFGDILSDEASMLTGSLGMLPSASMSDTTFGLYEPIHGSAPTIAGKNIANPLATILSVAMLLKHSLALDDAANSIEKAVISTLEAGFRTADIASVSDTVVGTIEMADAVLSRLVRE